MAEPLDRDESDLLKYLLIKAMDAHRIVPERFAIAESALRKLESLHPAKN